MSFCEVSEFGNSDWHGQLPLVVGGSGAEGQSAVTPFIQIPTSRDELQSTSGSANKNSKNTCAVVIVIIMQTTKRRSL